MTIAAARMLWDGCVCFVGIGLPSAACNLARLTHAPDIVLIYESGTIGTRPDVLPLSIGDGELAETAACVVPLPEVFSYYLQAGRVDVGFLGAAQIDRFGNLNSTVIGPYDTPHTRLPGAGGAPEIAAHARQTFVMLKASPRSFVDRARFPHQRRLSRRPRRARAQRRARRRPARGDHRFRHADAASATPTNCSLTALFADATVDEARAAVGWPLAAGRTRRHRLPPPTAPELDTLRALHARTREAHAQARGASRFAEPQRRHRPGTDPDGQLPHDAATHIQTELPGPKARAHDRARRRGDLALVSARLSVRDVARPRHRSLGRRRQPLPRLRRRHRGVQHRPRASAGGAGGEGRRRTSSCTSPATTGTSR